MLKDKTKAKNFRLPDQDGKIHTLHDYAGEWILIYFYPKDATPGCTIEACSFRDNMPFLEDIGVKVLGVSADSIESHNKFAQKHNLTFPLLSDTNKEMLQTYGVWQEKSMFGKKYMGIDRTSYLIDPEGKIAKVYQKVKPAKHVKEVIADLKEFSNK